MDRRLDPNVSIKATEEIDMTVDTFTKVVHDRALPSTSPTPPITANSVVVSTEIRELIKERRRLRRLLQLSRNPIDKSNFNRSSNYLKKRLAELNNYKTSNFLKNLDNSKETGYSLWKATKYLKRPTKRNVPIIAEDGS